MGSLLIWFSKKASISKSTYSGYPVEEKEGRWGGGDTSNEAFQLRVQVRQKGKELHTELTIEHL